MCVLFVIVLCVFVYIVVKFWLLLLDRIVSGVLCISWFIWLSVLLYFLMFVMCGLWVSVCSVFSLMFMLVWYGML